jgi:hypothetical protein
VTREPASKPEDGARADSAPAPLTVAALVVGLEALVLVGYGLSLLPSLTSQRLTMGATAVGFLTAYGAFLGYCGWRLWRLHSWARAPVVMAQLLQVPVGLSFWGGSTSWVAISVLALAAVVLAGVFHPRSLAALET